ncbi:multicopper oxidase domain-containing protein [Mangrovicoccus algicola]|uniref:Multicopper oxidase domain-containing protein n=1 Tax=Mangrovicoccus algicola TaxID=2771008 RepID=A0A8J6YPQ8_9RHOB|nr:multicopper oxidase domain-containing protein [Mangrovicoccus algicola]
MATESYTTSGDVTRVHRGEEFRRRLRNALDEETNFHWHGLAVPTEADGEPKPPLLPGRSCEISFPIRQRAGSNWHHPHPHGATAVHGWNGLGGASSSRTKKKTHWACHRAETEFS